jgi:DNA-binding transcriptional regulator YdaS (Cro superfamily)
MLHFMENAIEKACILVGGQSKMAVLLSTSGAPVSRQSVNNWIRLGKVPPDKATLIERIVDGKIRVEDLCPTFPWPKRKR